MTTRPNVRVAHIIAPSPAGGAETVVLTLASARPLDSLVVILDQTLGPDDPPGPLSSALRARGVEVHEIRAGRRRYLREIQELTSLLTRLGVTVAHTHGYHATLVGGVAATRADIARVATVHGYLGRNWKERAYDRLDKWMLQHFDRVIVVSEDLQQSLVSSGVRAERVVLVRNGLSGGEPRGRAEARAILGIEAEGPVIGWIGRFSYEKGADQFVSVCETSRVKGTTWVMIGDGPELETVREDASRRGLLQGTTDTPILLLGAVPQVSSLVSAFDLLLLTSRTEGTPMVLLEAVAAGVPIIAFSVGGVPKLLPTDCAYLVDAGDISSMAHSVRDALKNGNQAATRAARAKLLLEATLGIDRWIESVWMVYDAALQSRPQVSGAPS